MAVSAAWYGSAILGQFSATAARRVDWVGDTIKCSLHTSTYTPNQDTHVYKSDLTNELSGAGYTAGGVALTTKTDTYDTASNETRLDADDPAWAAITGTFRYAVFYKDTGVAGTSPLLGYVDFGADQTLAGSAFSITLDATGALKVTAT